MADITEIRFENARDFLAYLRLANDHWWDAETGRASHVFRGHTDHKWPLIPSGLRPLGPTNKLTGLITEIDRRIRSGSLPLANPVEGRGLEWAIWGAALWEAMFQFSTTAWSAGLSTPILDSKSILSLDRFSGMDPFDGSISPELGALGQHYGVPSVLLDWGENPLVAAYFAAELDAEPDICVWALRQPKESLRADPDIGTNNLVVHFSRISLRGNDYLRAQTGLFTRLQGAAVLFLQTGSWPSLEEIHQFIPVPILTKLTLSRSCVPVLRDLLVRERMTPAHIKPSLDTVGATTRKWLSNFREV